MFTGIIEDLGTITAVTGSTLAVATRLDGIALGDSVAVNGICLTAVAISPRGTGRELTFDHTPETRKRTNLGVVRLGTPVNLERALRADSRLGGHFLSGHVECQAPVASLEREKDSWLLAIARDPAFDRYVVSKGSIGIDGISLTVAAVLPRTFTVAVIPHTYEHTTLRHRRPGDRVNIEPDILAKYTERLLADGPKQKLSAAFLTEHGF